MARLADLSVYIHVPFCRSKCSYCDFYSVTGADPVIVDRFLDRALDQLKQNLEELHPDCIKSVYIGGGTPSLISPLRLERFLGALGGVCGPVEEYTIEANPESVDEEFLEVLNRSSVDRISLGVQSYDSQILEWLHRPAGAEAVHQADRLLAGAWARRLSRDLLAALPRSHSVLSRDVTNALKNETGHISVYELTIEPGTPLARDRSALSQLPNEDSAADEWEQTVSALQDKGLNRYEVSNFARPGEESLHNMRYWTMRPYLGIGPGAASTIPDADGRVLRREEPRDLLRWLGSSDPVFQVSVLGYRELMLETFMMGLRIRKGISRENFHRVFGTDPVEMIPRSVERWHRAGILELKSGSLAPTANGLDFIDSVMKGIAGELNGTEERPIHPWASLTPLNDAC